ncbi:alcohol dehydrogenase catalytic domain-containing protein [bacterium]|uniref:Alcohol dehydrogenase catalytic domain-containing protein n=1 Tax=Candidatus Scatenecus faecavium TaxID=2840915 RepID=A0A9D1FX20_9BACT|nr:alcohol dehydrogenase catalytic domain-containing protein [bacterium]HIS83702.1 alcohol dehydrogenase catalytic domain-containing protein [Candidatus Scatenecus faecavium]
MKTAVIDNDKILVKKVDDISLDECRGALVKVLGCGLCGSDIVKFREKISPDGTVLGHEIVAEILDINSDTKFKKGDKIVTSHHIPCGECIYCKSGNVSMCEHFKKTNIKPGGFSELVYLSEEHLQNVAHLLPENLDEIEGAFYEPLGCCVRAVRRADLPKGSTVLVVGLGSIGILMAQALKSFGMNVIGCDLIDERIQILKNLGLEAINSSDFETSKQFVFSKTENYGVDAVFMTSGADKAIDFALKLVRNGGKILVFASTPKNFGYPNNEIYYRELTVLGSYSPAPSDLSESLELLRTGKVKVQGLSTVYALDEINQAFEDTISNKILKAYIKVS